ncbi:hypothetical protein [Micromonospora fulviviridis]|uniref:RNA polymerase subunit sigma-70 n=1 Tax=Micromonospora fulviviridis TaxID=47860 RepID=A0ABV2VWB8_9ACTN
MAKVRVSSQQHLHRARHRITAARRRSGEVDPASARRIVEEFLAAASSGRTERLVALLTDDATAISDGAGGGLTETLLRYDTPQRIAAVVRAGFKPTPAKRRLAGGTLAIHYALVNGAAAILFVLRDQVVGAVAFDITNGKIAPCAVSPPPPVSPASPKPGGSTNRAGRSSPSGDPTPTAARRSARAAMNRSQASDATSRIRTVQRLPAVTR